MKPAASYTAPSGFELGAEEEQKTVRRATCPMRVSGMLYSTGWWRSMRRGLVVLAVVEVDVVVVEVVVVVAVVPGSGTAGGSGSGGGGGGWWWRRRRWRW